ncbi:hypothetical protein DAPPUDRAFT_308270 [Daphnia pulex]|uniref:Amine oxidase domain-containing protein n=1 Tax=Daphnia pulex TaxID=6669 RepID=E9H739_DAPPU|nr:hypothetical protein DAPPUDRAFT_308270 [Daphnia pulex]|eukprot:EFX72451.1 hypothetical protein DAPPUDRAFT_308270 [Daphnia pulex]
MDWTWFSTAFPNAIGITASVLLCYCLKKIVFTTSQWRSPFAEDSRASLTPLEIDQTKRDQVLKRGIRSLATEKKWDAIVIGSGIGGMATAALLSKAGMKVLVLEKHYKCGGACHTFIEQGYEFDVGIHYVGNFIRPTLTRTLLEQITDGQIQWAQLENGFDRVIMNSTSPLRRDCSVSSGKDAWKNQLLKEFPGERKAIEQFFALMKRANHPLGYSLGMSVLKTIPLWLAKAMCFLGLPCLLSDYFVLNKRSLEQVVRSLTDNRDLQFLLAYSAGGFGVKSNRVSVSMAALLHVHCCEYGSCYPVGGASEIPYRIVPVIERSGGRVLMKAHVSQILTENGRVTGVRVGHKEQSAVDLYAPIVISDAGLQNTFQDLLPENVAKLSPSWSLVNSLSAALGNLTVFIGLKGTPEELGLTAQNVWIFTNFHPMDDEPDSEAVLQNYCTNPYPAIFISSASAKDPSWEKRHPDRSTISVVSFIPYSFFAKWSHLKAKKRGDDYNALKNAIGLQIIDQVIRQYPKMKNAIDYFSVATPVTIEHYLSTKKGGTYGLEHDMERFGPEQSSLLRPESGIEGLFFSGQDVTTCGFASTMLSGLLCAGAVLKKKYSIAFDLLSLHTKLSGRPENLDSLFF